MKNFINHENQGGLIYLRAYIQQGLQDNNR